MMRSQSRYAWRIGMVCMIKVLHKPNFSRKGDENGLTCGRLAVVNRQSSVVSGPVIGIRESKLKYDSRFPIHDSRKLTIADSRFTIWLSAFQPIILPDF